MSMAQGEWYIDTKGFYYEIVEINTPHIVMRIFKMSDGGTLTNYYRDKDTLTDTLARFNEFLLEGKLHKTLKPGATTTPTAALQPFLNTPMTEQEISTLNNKRDKALAKLFGG